jgi:hypothetical protein
MQPPEIFRPCFSFRPLQEKQSLLQMFFLSNVVLVLDTGELLEEAMPRKTLIIV